jgi:WD40 repeat protein
MRMSILKRAAVVLGSTILAAAPGPAAPPARTVPPVGPAADAHGDPLPAGALRRLGTVRLRHGSPVQALAFAPDGKTLAAAGGNDPVRLWEPNTGKEVRQLRAQWVQALAWSPDGKLLAGGDAFRVVHLWETTGGKEVARFQGHTGALLALAFSPDGKLVASAGHDRTIRLLDVAAQKEIAVLTGHRCEVTCLAFSPDGKRLASGGDWTVRLWDVPGGKIPRQLDAGCAVAAVAFSPDGTTLASAGDDNVIRLWDAARGVVRQRLTGHKQPVTGLAFLSGGKGLVSLGRDRTVRVWDLEKGAEVRAIPCSAGDADALAVHAEGGRGGVTPPLVAAAGSNQVVRLWQADTGKEVLPTGWPRSPVSATVLTPDGVVIAGSNDGRVGTWEARSGKPLHGWEGAQRGPISVAVSPDGTTLAVAGVNTGVRQRDVAGINAERPLEEATGDAVLALGWSPAGKLLAVAHRGGAVRLWDPVTGQAQRELRYPGGAHALAFSPEGGKGGVTPPLLAAAGNGRVIVWNADTGQEVRQIDTQQPAACLAFSPDGKLLAGGMYDSNVRLWDPETAREVRALVGHSSAVYALAFTPDGRGLVTGGFDRTVRLWETASGLPIQVWKGHLGPVTAVAVTPDGRTVLSGSADTTLLLWDVTGRCQGGRLAADKLTPTDVDSLWQQLAAESPHKAHAALWALVAAARDSVPLLKGRVFSTDPERLKKLLGQLGSDDFRVREEATRKLKNYGRWIEGVLDQEMHKPIPTEARSRINDLLRGMRQAKVLSLQQERLRTHRLMQVLEQSGLPQARHILRDLARGATEPEMREEARATLRRLERGTNRQGATDVKGRPREEG